MSKYSTEIKWAVVFVIMTLFWMIGERLTGLHDTHIDKHPIYTNLIAIPAILVYVLALRNKKINDLRGTMDYMQGLITGLIMTLIITILSPLTQYVVSTVITPAYFNNVIAYSVDAGIMDQEAAEAYFNLKSYIIQGLIWTPVMGFLTTAVVAFFVKSKTSN